MAAGSAITTTESCEYRFSQDEIVQLARDQARLSNERDTMENRFAVAKKQYNADMEMKQAEIRRAGLGVTQGYELRDIECLKLKFRPDKDSLMIVRTDTGRVFRHRKMRDEEKQMTLTAISDPFVMMAEFYEDNNSELMHIVAEVGLTASEYEKLKDVPGMQFQPTLKQLEAGKPKKK